VAYGYPIRTCTLRSSTFHVGEVANKNQVEDKQTLARLCAVSQWFYINVTPKLYHTIELDIYNDDTLQKTRSMEPHSNQQDSDQDLLPALNRGYRWRSERKSLVKRLMITMSCQSCHAQEIAKSVENIVSDLPNLQVLDTHFLTRYVPHDFACLKV